MVWNNPLLFLIALGATAAGIVHALWTLARIRPPLAAGEPLLAWTETPRSGARRDPLGLILISVETVVVMSLAFLLLQSVSRPVRWPLPEMGVDLQLRMLSFLVAGGSVAVVFYLSGGLITIPLRGLRARAAVVSIFPGGICEGAFLLAWDRFDHFQTDPTGGVIRLYSRYSPDISSMVLYPPSTDAAQKAGDLLAGFLSRKDRPGSIPWLRRKTVLLLCFIVLMSVVTVADIGVAQIPTQVAWFLQVVLVWGFSFLTGRLVTVFYSFSGFSATR